MPFKKKRKIPKPPAHFFPKLKKMKIEKPGMGMELPELPEMELPEETEQLPRKLPEKLTREAGKEYENKIIKSSRSFKSLRPLGIAVASSADSKGLFIKVEKFKEILASIDMIEKKTKEIETVIKKLREIRSKEEYEIEEWEKQLSEIKARLQLIEKNLEKVEG